MADAPRVLVLFAHPALQKSRINRRLVREPQTLDGVTFRDLYEAYPRFDIDVTEEQRLLLAHDVVVFQHPFYWYSTPAILKEWQDLVLEHGWAYGSEGDALRGKLCLDVITTGGREEAYREGGANRYSIQQFLAPLAQTAALCGMRFLPPFVVHGTHAMSRDAVEVHAHDYRRVLRGLRDRTLDPDAAGTLARLNEDLDRILPTAMEG